MVGTVKTWLEHIAIFVISMMIFGRGVKLRMKKRELPKLYEGKGDFRRRENGGTINILLGKGETVCVHKGKKILLDL